MQATIHAEEAGDLFLGWCETRPCQATEAAWWQHIESITDVTVSAAYAIAFSQDTCELYNMLVRMPLAAPRSDSLVEAAFASKKKWS
ncbi:hypothetical protein E4U14_002283 [Claviceps sp. LM454 group G7]|nr:hypothetical protein E4U14_002283 [Claviceps sp. LM454 group G7]